MITSECVGRKIKEAIWDLYKSYGCTHVFNVLSVTEIGKLCGCGITERRLFTCSVNGFLETSVIEWKNSLVVNMVGTCNRGNMVGN